jgi:hypothetical protein
LFLIDFIDGFRRVFGLCYKSLLQSCGGRQCQRVSLTSFVTAGYFIFAASFLWRCDPNLGDPELVRSLSKSSQASARLRADLLYRHSQGIFAAAATMLSSDEINRLVKEFYELTLAVDDHRRLLPEQPWTEGDHQARSDYLDQILIEHRDALRQNDFDKATPAAQIVMARHNMAESDLGPGEYNRIRQAILRASIDIIGLLTPIYSRLFAKKPLFR